MPQFTINGIVWKPRINCFVMRQFEDQFQVPFAQAGEILKQGRLKPLITLAFFSVGKQAADLNISMTDFERSIETAEQLQAMSESVAGALNDFFQNPAVSRKPAGLESQSDGVGETSTK